jgi:hypothetical protein
MLKNPSGTSRMDAYWALDIAELFGTASAG